jgi:hypothetical protein
MVTWLSRLVERGISFEDGFSVKLLLSYNPVGCLTGFWTTKAADHALIGGTTQTRAKKGSLTSFNDS